MAIKKNVFQNYVEENKKPTSPTKKNNQFNNHRVFDDPPIDDKNNKAFSQQAPKQIKKRSSEARLKNKQGTERGTKRGTERGTEQSSEVRLKNKQGTERGTKRGTERGTDKLLNPRDFPSDIWEKIKKKRSYYSLSGVKKILIDSIFEICSYNNQRETPPLSLNALTNLCDSSVNTVKKARNRLINEDHILKTRVADSSPRTGRSSLLIYSFSDDFWHEINSSKMLFSHAKGSAKRGTERGTERGTKRGTDSPSSSSIYTNTTTTKLSLNLKKLRALLNKHGERILDKTLLKVHLENKLTIDQMQASIDHFCYTLEHKTNCKTLMRKVKVASLLDVLRDGRPYIDPDFRTPEEIELDRNKPSSKEINEWNLRLIELNGEVEHWSKFLAFNKDTSQEENMRSFLEEAQQKLIQHMETKPEGAD